MHRIAGPFVQSDYGFSVTPPRRIPAYVTNGGDANHGVVMILGNHRDIVAYGDYTGMIDGDTMPCRPRQFPWETTSPGSPRTILLVSGNSFQSDT